MSKIVGISGISGAGKTELVKALSKKLNSSPLFWDDFDAISSAPNDYLEWYNQGGDYTAFNYDELANALKLLKADAEYHHPVIKKKLLPTKYVFADLPLGKMHKQTAQYVDIFFYIDVPLDIALARRIIRDYEAKHGDDLLNELNDYLLKHRKLFVMDDVKTTADTVLDGTLSIDKLRDQIIKTMSDKFQ